MSDTLTEPTTRPLREAKNLPWDIFDGVLTLHPDGTRVARNGRPLEQGTTVGATADDYQTVKWDKGRTTHTHPRALALVVEEAK